MCNLTNEGFDYIEADRAKLGEKTAEGISSLSRHWPPKLSRIQLQRLDPVVWPQKILEQLQRKRAHIFLQDQGWTMSLDENTPGNQF